ncbi:PepSY domain-containing protein [Arenibacter sp. F26102]|uniref:PepSY-associated TM helix domain-containing protein n=1 Tax=Arenibacter sp. F26102 TaxID=2926416 RepID=UPI001FF253BE|nr:PepSY-associated TM helix domain-containing protein [Arenibacter sp. F26102]MCK0147276.1 PepSY domain-containing protein [Arenibacter sp. F26102]
MIIFNRFIRNLHLWLGLTCGLIASISGLTGSLYIWQPEITSMLNPELLTIGQNNPLHDTSLYTTASNLMEQHGDSIAKINLPYRQQQTISLIYKNGETLYYHPFTADFLGEKSASIEFFEDLLNFHRTLGIPKIGKYITGTSTILFFLLLLSSGTYLWWKTYSTNFIKGFQIKWTAKKKKLNYDLHKVLGVSFFIPLMVIAFTGAYFTYSTYYRTVLSIFDDTEITKLNLEEQTIGSAKPYQDYLRTPDKDYDLRAVILPKNKQEGYHFRYIEDRFLMAGLRKTKELKIDPTGTITSLTDFQTDSNGNRIAAQFYPVHIGEIGGLFGRILVFISGLIPIILYITGLRLYLLKKKKRLI